MGQSRDFGIFQHDFLMQNASPEFLAHGTQNPGICEPGLKIPWDPSPVAHPRSQLTHFSVQNLKHLFKDLILNIKTFRNSEVNEFLDLDKTRLRLKKCATKGRSLSLAQKEAPIQDSQRLGFVPKNASIQNTTSFTSIMLSAVLQNKVENLTSQKANNLSPIRISLKSVQKT